MCGRSCGPPSSSRTWPRAEKIPASADTMPGMDQRVRVHENDPRGAPVEDVRRAQHALDELLADDLLRIKAYLQVDTVAVLLLDEYEETLVARAAIGLEEEVEQGVRIPVGKGFAGRVAA